MLSITASLFIYLAQFNASSPFIETISALIFFWYLLRSDSKVWFWSGFFIAFFWFWWIMMSFQHYHITWAIPIGLLSMSFVYGAIFWFISYLSELSIKKFFKESKNHLSSITYHSPFLKSLGLLCLSYLHPLSFDWFKPELLFVHSYIGIQKWQFAIVLFSISLAQYKKSTIYLLLILLAYSPSSTRVQYKLSNLPVALASTMTTVEQKWDPKLVSGHIVEVFRIIDDAIRQNKKIIVLPESIFPFFLNKQPRILHSLEEKSHKIAIVIGGLYLDANIHHNSTYIIQNGKYTIANKTVLVPFGESNPLPHWAGNLVNKIFFDGAVDYVSSSAPTDFMIAGKKYRNAICYEACSEPLYAKHPKRMIVISNNGWFYPSIEPTLQRLLLEYYSRKYGTTIYHSANMSPSYVIMTKK